MTLFAALSILFLLVGAGWCLVLIVRVSDWRSRLLAALLGVVALALLLPQVAGIEEWSFRSGFDGLSSLGTSAVALLAVGFLGLLLTRHQLLERRLGKKEAYLESLFEGSSEAILLLDAGGAVLQANQGFGRMFGYEPEELVGRSVLDMIVPEARKEEAHELRERMMRGEQVNLETVRLHREGASLDVSILGAPVQLVNGKPAAFAVYRDITQRVDMEGASRRFETALATMQLGVTITDLHGRIMFTNSADAEMHGYSVDELIGRDVRVFAPEGKAKPLSTGQIEAMKRWGRETTNARRNGEIFPVRLLSDVVRDRNGDPVGIVTTCEDITQRKRAEQALRESEERYALAIRGGTDGLWDWNLENDEVYYSARWKEMLGFEEAEVGTSPAEWLDRVHPGDLAHVKAELASHREGRSTRFEQEHRIEHKDGSYRWVLARGIAERDPSGKPYRIAGAITDITDRKGLEEQLAKDALYDHLTGLPNRAFLGDLLERSFLQAQRQRDHRFGVLFLDLDRFKVVNDSMGHAAGDQLLIEVSRRIKQSVRPGDVVARFGGDEFCVLLDEIRDNNDTTRVARRILAALEEPVVIDDREIFTSTSIGIAVHEHGLDGPEHLLRHADTALYRAKARGKARFEVFDQEMHERAVAQLELESDLRDAVEEAEFRVLYQPVVSLDDGRIIAFEALLRWQSPSRGTVPLSEFLPLAEETGLIVPIGNWVLAEACKQMASWVRRFPSLPELTVSVNLSAKQLRQPNLVDVVEDAIREASLPPPRLRLEVSEQVLMDDADRNIELINRLRRLGVRVQIDDFGTGSSSLSYLHRFSVDTLKIDRSFVSRIGLPGDRAAVIQAVITLARDMGIDVIAEGIETEDQSARLMDLHCDRGQGYLFSQPLDAEAAEDFLATRTSR